MAYIYDILLNFNKELYEYFEWNESDNIKYVKKIVLFKTDTKVIKDIIENDVLFEESFMKNIPSYEMTGQKDPSKLLLLTDGLIVIGVLIKNNKSVSISRLLLDEEYEILGASSNLEYIDIKLKILKKKKIDKSNVTRKEKNKKDYLLKSLNHLYENSKRQELLYLYYEYTGKESSNIDYVYNFLKNSLKNFTDKHEKLLNILNMAKTNND